MMPLRCLRSAGGRRKTWRPAGQPGANRARNAGSGVVLRVFLDVVLLVLGHVVGRKDGIGGANRNARAAVNAAFRIHVHLVHGLELLFVVLGMNAVGGAGVSAELVLQTGIGDY